MLTNKAALEAAQDMFDFEEDLALEADELIDTMVDGMCSANCFDDEIEEMEEDFEEAEEINDELEDEDNFTGTVGKSANEAAALTGMSFLSSLVLDKDDPITTKNGSIGSDDGTANHKDNFSNASRNTTDKNTTKNGAIGADSSANPANNFSDASKDTNDKNTTKNGSIGAYATAKDPAVESAMFFGELLGEEVAMEGLIQKMKDKYNEKRSSKRLEKLKMLGISSDIDNAKLSALIQAGKHSEAKRLVAAFGKKLENAKAKISDDDPEASKKRKYADQLIKTTSCLMIGVDTDSEQKKFEKAGVDKATAKKQAMKKMRDKEKNSAMESYINECLDMIEAFEATCTGTDCDPEDTENGSIGQKDSKASFSDNFSDASKDTDDPIKAEAGSEGQKDSKASFDENYSGGSKDTDDPIQTENGSVGQKDSTAKDPVIESTLDELEELNSILLDDYEDDDPYDI